MIRHILIGLVIVMGLGCSAVLFFAALCCWYDAKKEGKLLKNGLMVDLTHVEEEVEWQS